MKVCFLIYAMYSGGAERTTSYLANWGVSNGYDVDIVMYSNDGVFYELDKRIKTFILNNKINGGTKLNIFSLPKKYLNYLSLRKQFKEYAKENKPDIIFAVMSDAVLYTLGVKNIPVIASERGNPKNRRTKMQKFKRDHLINKTKGLIFQTTHVQDYFKNKLKVNSVVIPNAVGNPYVYEINYDEKNTENKICAVGSLYWPKDYFTMLDAFKIILEKHKDFILEIFGIGVDEDKLKQYAKDINIYDNVAFKGVNPKAIYEVSKAKCYVLSSISEGMPNSLMEAMAIGMPCVSTDCEFGPSDLIENGKNGLLVPTKSPEKLAEAINKMIEDRGFALKCGAEAKKLRESNSIEAISRRYYNFFEETIKSFKKK